jgi:hypothetical protein
MSAAAALAVAVTLAGCGTTTYFAGRTLPPSGVANRVLITVQNPGSATAGAVEFVDAYYDIRGGVSGKPASFSISGYPGSSAIPSTIQNMPEEQMGAVYGSDGSFTLINYAKENASGSAATLNGPSSSVFITRSQSYVFAANQISHVLTVVDKTTGGSYPFSLPGVYRVSVNPGGSMALAFVQNSDYIYYPRKLSSAESITFSGGPGTWPTASGAVDCEPQSLPAWCLFQALDPTTGKALTFDRPTKAVFSADGGTAYVLSCGLECGGTAASITPLSVAPMIFLVGQQSGALPTQSTVDKNTLSIPGGASNALVDGSTMYVVGQELMQDGYWGGHLTVVTLPASTSSTLTATAPVSISDGAPGAASKMIEADDNTLWIGMTKCTNGEHYNNNQAYGCLTMYNTSTQAVTLLPYLGDATGIAAVTSLHKIYTAEGGQVYIYSTVNGTAYDNQYVTVTGTAYDVAYMDALTDANNTTY